MTAVTTHALRLIGCWALKLSGANAYFRWRNRAKVLVLWYHGVSKEEIKELMGYDERHISRECFHNHLRFLKAKGYRFISLDQYTDSRRKGVPLEKAVVLTFDDGFRNVLENAEPLMREFGASGTIYVVVDSAKSGKALWTDQVEFWVRAHKDARLEVTIGTEKMTYPLASEADKQKAMKDIKRRLRALDDDQRRREIDRFYQKVEVPGEFQIATLAEFAQTDPATLQVGGHSMHHPNLTQLRSAQEFDVELAHSRRELESATHKPVYHFAYPAGAYNAQVIEEVRRAGYLTAVTTRSGLNDDHADPFELKRVGTNSSHIMFEAMTSGSYFAVSRFFRT